LVQASRLPALFYRDSSGEICSLAISGRSRFINLSLWVSLISKFHWADVQNRPYYIASAVNWLVVWL